MGRTAQRTARLATHAVGLERGWPSRTATTCVGVFVGLLLGVTLGVVTEEPKFDVWLREHRQCCPRCGHPESTLCDLAFARLQIGLRQYEAAPQFDLARATQRWCIEEERAAVAREFSYMREKP